MFAVALDWALHLEPARRARIQTVRINVAEQNVDAICVPAWTCLTAGALEQGILDRRRFVVVPAEYFLRL